MNRLSQILMLLILATSISSCSTKKATTTKKAAFTSQVGVTGPHVIIYKTRADYFDLVPVTLSPDNKKITGYPSHGDLVQGKNFRTPTRLNKGFLLDNRGINENVAFIDMTYEQYTMQMRPIPTSELYLMLRDKDPLKEMYDMGKRSDYQDIVKELNALINSGQYKQYKKLH